MDATDLLKKDHQEVTKLFQRFQADTAARARRSVVEKICQELTVHTQIEEEIFYPAVRDTGDAQLSEKVDESYRDHQRVKDQVQALRAHPRGEEDGTLESMVATLEQDVERHVTEEEGEMFPRVQELMEERALSELGARLRQRKDELTGGGRRRPAGGRKPAAARGKATGRRVKATGRRVKTTGRRSKAVGKKSSGRKKARGGRGR